jgi:hypothetical protein
MVDNYIFAAKPDNKNAQTSCNLLPVSKACCLMPVEYVLLLRMTFTLFAVPLWFNQICGQATICLLTVLMLTGDIKLFRKDENLHIECISLANTNSLTEI